MRAWPCCGPVGAGTREKGFGASPCPNIPGQRLIANKNQYGEDFEAAVRLRDAARKVILEKCHEPDLAHEQILLAPEE